MSGIVCINCSHKNFLIINHNYNTMKHLLKLFFAICCISLTAFSVQAQEEQQMKKITGTVLDKAKEPVMSATVLIVGTRNGTMTDFDGHFELSVPEGAVIEVSFTGYETQKQKVTASKTHYSFTLQDDTKAIELEEVVSVGYATQKKSELTGSITSVKASDVKDFSSKSLAESLTGMAAGVTVTKSSGTPGEEADIMIRGLGSINGMKPLYIVDGVPQGAGFNFNMRDVESIEILKDAGSAAIYGARAAGGVILITTKKGAKAADCAGAATVSVNARYGIRNIATDIKLLDRDQYLLAQSLTNPNGMAGVLAGFNVSDPSELPSVNWLNEMYSTGIEQEYNVALSGGNEKTAFYLSSSYYDEKGTFLDTRAKRFSLRNNLEYKLTKHITIGESVYGSARTTNPSRPGDYANSIPFLAMPTMAPKDADGNWSKLPNGHAQPNLYANEMIYHVNKDIGYTGNLQVYANVNFMDGLDWRTTAAGEFYGYSTNKFTESYDFGAVKNANNSMDAESGTSSNLTFNSTLTYDTKKLLGSHNLKVMIGAEVLKYDSYALLANAQDFPLPTSESLRLLGGETGPYDKRAWDNPWIGRSMSVFGRVNYAYLGKYLLTVNVRRDGSDKFGPNNRWGTFPSVNGAWRISEESFVRDNVTWLDNAKLRASYGILGNDNIDQFLYVPYLVSFPKYAFGDDESVSGWQLRSHPNADIKWEEVHQLDLGIDLAFLRNRLNVTYDYYNRQTQGMLYDKQVPLTSGVAWYFGSMLDDILIPIKTNAGKMENQGHEITVTWSDKTLYGLKYTLGVNASFNSNLMKSIGEYVGEAAPYDAELLGWGAPVTRTADGNPVSMFYGYKVKGIFKTQEEVDAYNQNAKDRWGNTFWYQQSRTGVGDLIYEDVNGDGRITSDDRTFIGNPWPKAVLGMNFNFEYKGFDLGLNFQSALGFDIYNAVKAYTQSFTGENTTADYFNASFLGDNGLTDQPRVGYWSTTASGAPRWIGDGAANQNYSTVSSYFVEKGDYLKLKNLVLGYTLPANIAKKVYMQNFRVYLSAQNVFTLTKYSGIDPEIANYRNPVTDKENVLQRGVDTYTRYLPSRLYSIGIDLTF